jgi:hypothetical protein
MIRYHAVKIFSHFTIVFLNNHFSFITCFLILAHILDHLHLSVFIHPAALIVISLCIYIYFSEHFLFKIKFQLLLEAYFLHNLPIRLFILVIHLHLTVLWVLPGENLLMQFFIQYYKMIY